MIKLQETLAEARLGRRGGKHSLPSSLPPTPYGGVGTALRSFSGSGTPACGSDEGLEGHAPAIARLLAKEPLAEGADDGLRGVTARRGYLADRSLV